MSLFQTHSIVEVRKLIIAAHNLNELGDGGKDEGDEHYAVTLAQLGEVFDLLAEHYEDTEHPFGGEEDVDSAMAICYGKLYVHKLGYYKE